MTYVTKQKSQTLRAHMRRLQAMDGWHDPLADRLYKEILELDAMLKAKVAQPVQPTPDADFKESVALMLAAVGYTETYARQWPNEKVFVTFKRWFDEQIENAKTAQPEHPSKGLFIDMIAAHGTEFAAEIATSTEQPVQPKRPTNCGTNFCSCIECLFDSPLVQPTKYGAA